MFYRDLPSEKLKYHTNVTFDVLDGDNDCDYANDVLKSIFDLGDKVRMRICILIDGSKGDTRTAFGEFMRAGYRGGGGAEGLDPPGNHKAISFLSNTGLGHWNIKSYSM